MRGYAMLNNPNLHPMSWLKPISIFPRWPVAHHHGPLLICFMALPIWYFALHVSEARQRLTHLTAISIGLLIFLAPFATQRIHVARFFIPAVFFVPEVLVAARRSLPLRFAAPLRTAAIGIATSVLLFGLYWFQIQPRATAELLRAHLYNEFVLPTQAAWDALFGRIVPGALAATLAMAWVLPIRGLQRWLTATVAGVGWSWLFFNGYTISLLTRASEFRISQFLLQAGLTASLGMVLGLFGRLWSRWYLFWALIFGCFVALNPYWRLAYRDLWRYSDYTLVAAQQLESHLPPHSIVVGRRATYLLRHTRLRTGMGHHAYSGDEFIRKLDELLDRYPTQPLYWLVDGDGCPPWSHYRSATSTPWRATAELRVLIPSGDTLEMQHHTENELPLIPLYLMRITKAGAPSN